MVLSEFTDDTKQGVAEDTEELGMEIGAGQGETYSGRTVTKDWV